MDIVGIPMNIANGVIIPQGGYVTYQVSILIHFNFWSIEKYPWKKLSVKVAG